MRRRGPTVAFAVAALIVLAGAGCSSGGDGDSGSDAGPSGKAVTIVDLAPYAVERSDLADGFGETQNQTEESAVACLRPADDLEKQLADAVENAGLIGCQAVTYGRKVGSDSDQIGTFAVLFKNADGAQAALPLLRDILIKGYRVAGDAKVVSVTELPVPALGDKALPGVLFKVAAGDAQTDHSMYLWRRGKVVAVLAAANFLGGLSPDASRDIATRIDTRAAG